MEAARTGGNGGLLRGGTLAPAVANMVESWLRAEAMTPNSRDTSGHLSRPPIVCLRQSSMRRSGITPSRLLARQHGLATIPWDAVTQDVHRQKVADSFRLKPKPASVSP